MHKVYLDNNATTQLDPKVIEAIVNSFSIFGNPSSTHAFGQESRKRINQARQTIASFFSVKSQEVIFTSSGTESANMILKGYCDQQRGHAITSNVEHSAVYSTFKEIESKGWEVSFLSPGEWGAIRPEELIKAIKPNTRLVSLMAVNNETGVKTDIDEIAKICIAKGIPFVVDGVAWLGKEPFQIPQGVSAIFFSGHKIHGPKGIGLAIVKNSLKIPPYIIGGEQEFGKRGGTENVLGMMGLAEAIKQLKEHGPAAFEQIEKLRKKFEESLKNLLPNVFINGIGPRISNTSNLYFKGVDGESLLLALDQEGIAASLGSACASGSIEPSRVLLNMGYSMERARSSIRFSLSRFTTEEEIDRVIKVITHLVRNLPQRTQSPQR